jgi:hypothetical protein
MAFDKEAQYVLYLNGAPNITLRSLNDDAVVDEVPLGHEIVSGAAKDDMIVTVGTAPNSVIIIRDHHHPDLQQLMELPDYPAALDIGFGQCMIAIMLDTGLQD